MNSRPEHEVRALFEQRTIRVYQAYSAAIALPALDAQTFKPPFSRSRMTWIKPSFTWMMYRAGWGMKPGQEYVLGIDIRREGFEWALAHSCLSHFDPAVHATPEAWRAALEQAPVRIQWDPERTVRLEPLPWRAIQIGLSGSAVPAYVDEWIVRIEDVTPLARELRDADRDRADARRPCERPYPLPPELARKVGATL
jgi:hypothetical protein